MPSVNLSTLRDASTAQADLIAAIGSGSVFGEIGERVAAAVTGSSRITGTGRDLRCSSLPGVLRHPSPIGLSAPGPVRTAYSSAVPGLHDREQRRYAEWRSSSDLLGEVKVRQLDKRYGRDQLLDTRSGGPDRPFFPFVDFYVLMIIDLAVYIAMARVLDLPSMVDYVASDVGRGGSWNYKASIHLGMQEGIDVTAQAGQALRSLRFDWGDY
jgi:hypothetical protein